MCVFCFCVFCVYYSLFVGGRDTDYTTEGEAEALTEVVLRVQVRRAEEQEPTARIRGDLRLPVIAIATSVVQITSIIGVAASAEEGERNLC